MRLRTNLICIMPLYGTSWVHCQILESMTNQKVERSKTIIYHKFTLYTRDYRLYSDYRLQTLYTHRRKSLNAPFTCTKVPSTKAKEMEDAESAICSFSVAILSPIPAHSSVILSKSSGSLSHPKEFRLFEIFVDADWHECSINFPRLDHRRFEKQSWT